MRWRVGEDSSKQGLVFTYNNHGLKWESIKKSSPNSSKALYGAYITIFG